MYVASKQNKNLIAVALYPFFHFPFVEIALLAYEKIYGCKNWPLSSFKTLYMNPHNYTVKMLQLLLHFLNEDMEVQRVI